MGRNNDSSRGVSGRGTVHSDMKMDVSPSSTTGDNPTEHRRPQHHDEGTGTSGTHASDDTAGLSPSLSAMGLNATKAIVINTNDEYKPARKRHHSSSSPAASNQKLASAPATSATAAPRTAIRNSSVHSSISSGGENGHTSKTTTTGASVKFAMPPKQEVGAEGSATGSSLSLSSYEDSNSKKISALKQKQQQQAAKDDGTNNNKALPPPHHTSGSKNDSSRSKSSSGSGSGSDGNEGGATSSSNPAVVTQSNYNTTSGSGGGDTRSTSGSGSGSDGGMGRNTRRTGGETSASNEYYFAGYGSGSLAGQASSSGNSGQGGRTRVASLPQVPQVATAGDAAGVAAPLPATGGMASFASFRGATLTAAANAASAMPPGANNNNNMSTSRHVAVATDVAGGLPPPPPQAQGSHLRHHLRRHHHHHHHHHRNELQVPPLPQGGVAASSRPVMFPARALDGIPSSIGGPHQALPQPQPRHQYELRLPPSDEQAVLQRVPQAHATVVAHDLPPPPTSSDAWSSGSGSSSKPRKLKAAARTARIAEPISVASAGMADGKTMGTLNENSRTSPTSSITGRTAAKPQAMHVSTDDPILRKKMSLKDEGTPRINKAGSTSHKRMAGAFTRESSDDSSDGVKSESEERSGSDGGYEAERPSSGSGSDSVSSDDEVATARNPLSNPSEVRMESQSNSKRTETSSMSSSVLADFSSVLNEDTHALHSGSSSPRSTSSSLTSIGNEAQAKTMLSPEVGAINISEKPPAPVAAQAYSANIGSKRDASHLKSPADNSKRSKPTSPVSFKLPSAANNTMKSGLAIIEKALQSKVRSAPHHHYHSRRSVGRKMLQESYLSAQRDLSESPPGVKSEDDVMKVADDTLFEEATIYSLGHDAMANIASFLHPQETHSFLTTPFSKTWLQTYTAPQELWKILCTSKPFFAMLPAGSGSGDDNSTSSYPLCNDLQMRHIFGRYRLLYASFVRCMKYMNRLQDDALNGREPTMTLKSNPSDIYPFNKNVSLKAYFAKARRIVRSRRNGDVGSEIESQESLTFDISKEKKRKRQSNGKSGPRLGNSMITNRLLRPTAAGEVDDVNLPWSCAIYSVVNWMVAFQDVEGIQIMCLKTLPHLLEDEQQRTTAQRAGLTDNVLRAMVLFPDSIELHTVAFHTLVLLARPLGGNEGMLFHTAMVNTRGIFNNGSTNSKNGIVIMLDSMRRFAQDEILQAMSCWSLVNVALTPLQKSILVKLGGLTVTANAMLQHPYNAEVQFRALFALINLVIPTEPRGPEETEQMRELEREIFQQLGEAGETTEREMLDTSVGQITNLVVVSMKNFCSSEAILNRSCLVLHNLSLNEAYHGTLLWTPNCYQMLEWCIGNYPHDHVLQQSAGGTLQRLNATLSSNEELRVRFTHSIRAQQQHSLELARQEAVYLQEQHLLE